MPSKSSFKSTSDSSRRRKAPPRSPTHLVEAPDFPEYPVDDVPQIPEPDLDSMFSENIPEVPQLQLAGRPSSSRYSPSWDSPQPSASPPFEATARYRQQPSHNEYTNPPSLAPRSPRPDFASRQYSSPTFSASPLSRSPNYYSSPRSAYTGTKSNYPIHPPPNPKQQHRQRDYTYNTAPSRPHFRSLDSLEAAGAQIPASSENVVLSGYDSRLEIHAVGHSGLRLIGRIDQIHGAVLSAKIVPSTTLHDDFLEQRPLVALMIHGPPTEPVPESNGSDSNKSFHDGPFMGQENRLQTRVEVWSFKNGSPVATLYKSPLIPLPFNPSTYAPNASPDAGPFGKLRIEIQGEFIAVASGVSGEVFVFTPSPHSKSSDEPYRCIAKFWTSIVKVSPHRPSSSSSAELIDSGVEKQFEQIAVFSLSHRWLAIAPPSSQSRHSIQGSVPISYDAVKPVGVESVTPSAPPVPNCTLDVPNPESLTNKVARGVAKEVLKGAQWVGAQGWQAWQNYWKPSSQPSSSASVGLETAGASQFPPTHAEGQGINTEIEDKGDLISIIDLKHLLQNASKSSSRRRSEPLATFSMLQGCCFVSFSPHGLLLLTVSGNGDTQHVWNLSKIRGRRDASNDTSTGNVIQSSVSQVATFSRFSTTRVVDVVWSPPKNDKLAVVTERGTVHLFKLPNNPFIWPLRHDTILRQGRRSSSQEPGPAKQETEIGDTRLPLNQASTLSAAASKVSSKARPIVTTVRERSNSGVSTLTSNFSNFNVSTAAGIQGGKYLVNGVSKSFGAAAGHISQMRRASASRLSIKGGQDNIRQNCVRFLTGKDRGYIGALSHDSLSLHRLQTTTSTTASKEIEVPLQDPTALPLNQQPNFWLPSRKSSRPDADSDSIVNAPVDLAGSLHPLASAEIDTSASFQPFYVDKNVSLSTYATLEPWDYETPVFEDPHHLQDANPWVFGGTIRTVPVELLAQVADKEDYPLAPGPSSPLQTHQSEPEAQAVLANLDADPDLDFEVEVEPVIPDITVEPHTTLNSALDEENLEDSTLRAYMEDEAALIDFGSPKFEQ